MPCYDSSPKFRLYYECHSRSIDDWIEENVGSGKVVSRSMVSSSSWSSAYVYTTDGGKKLFVKQSSNGGEGMFKGEALGLQAMYGVAQRHAFLIAHAWRDVCA